jgi:hypothetical protein
LIAAIAPSWSGSGWRVVSAPWPKATTPTSTVSGWASTKLIAAAWAAPSRLGSTSSADMLLEMSKARITVPLIRGIDTVACGRATASSSSATAVRNITGGRCRRSAAQPVAGLVSPAAARARDRWRCSQP